MATQDLSADLIGNRYGHLPFRRRVINYSTLSTATLELTEAESGAIFFVPTVSTVKLSLPRISSKRLGLNYEIFFSTFDALADFNIVSTNDSSADIALVSRTSALSTASAITPATSVGTYAVRLTAVSSVRWMMENISGGRPSSANTSDLGVLDTRVGEWFVGTTV